MMNIRFSPHSLSERFFSLLAAVLAAVFLAACSSYGGASGEAAPRPIVDPSLYGGLGAADDLMPFMQNARHGTLPNGMSYYILKNTLPENRAYLALAVDAGSVLEEEDERGLAHFVEHMAFNGTKRFPGLEVDSYLQSLGMRNGADSNAYTNFDRTVYRINVPVEGGSTDGDKKIPQKALDIMEDWTDAVLFTQKDVDEERPVILEEDRMRRSASSRVWQKMYSVIFHGSRYADREPIGLASVIETAPSEKLAAFYQKWYRPQNMALIIAGDFDEAALEAELVARFNAPPSAPFERPAYFLPPPEQGRLSVDVFTEPELPYTAAYLFYKRDPSAAPRAGTLGAFREELIDALVRAMMEERFDDAASDPDCPYMGAWAYNTNLVETSLHYYMGVQPKSGRIEDAVKALLREKEKMSRYGFMADELERAKANLLADFERQAGEKRESYPFVEDFTEHFLTGEAVPDALWEFNAAKTLLPLITPEETAAFARYYVGLDDLSFILAGSDTEPLPSSAAVTSWIRASKKEKIEPPATISFDAALLEETPQAGAIVKETRDAATEALIWELDNGATVILKPVANKNDEIVLSAVARGGVTAIDENDDVSVISARFASILLAQSGVGGFSLQDIQKKLAGRNVGLSFSADSFVRRISGTSTVKDVQVLFELLYLSFVQPTVDPRAASAVISQYETYLSERELNPEAVFSNEVGRMVTGNSPYSSPIEKADLAKIDIVSALAFLKTCLNPADWTFVFAGNIDPSDFRPLVETYTASIPASESRFKEWADKRIPRPASERLELRRGKEDKSLVSMVWFADEPYSEAKNAAVLTLADYLNIALDNSIREKLGGVYSIYASSGFVADEPVSELIAYISFPCDPRRSTELIAAVEAEFKKVASGAIDAETLDKAKEARKKAHENFMQDNEYIAQSYAQSAAIYKSPLSRTDEKYAMFDAVRAADLQYMASTLFDAGYSIGILYPEQ